MYLERIFNEFYKSIVLQTQNFILFFTHRRVAGRCINMPLNPCFEEKKREKLGYFETLCTRVEERGTRFVRGEIGLVKEFISLFSSNLLRIIKNEVKFIVKSIISFTQRGVGCCSSSVMKIDSRIHKTFLTRSTFRPLYPQPYGLRVVRQLRTRYAALKALRDFFLMPLLPSNRLVSNKRRR